jgi:hypothetical protein
LAWADEERRATDPGKDGLIAPRSHHLQLYLRRTRIDAGSGDISRMLAQPKRLLASRVRILLFLSV